MEKIVKIESVHLKKQHVKRRFHSDKLFFSKINPKQITGLFVIRLFDLIYTVKLFWYYSWITKSGYTFLNGFSKTVLSEKGYSQRRNQNFKMVNKYGILPE